MILQVYSFLVALSYCEGYRHLHFTNADVCDPLGSTKVIPLGDGAMVLSLNIKNNSLSHADKTREEPKTCHIKVKAREGYGLMTYVEDLYLRMKERNYSQNNNCLDYLEFGQDDIVPFITLKRSEKLCGDRVGYHFDEPGGVLLIWLRLGAYKPSGALMESLADTRVSLVITPYRKQRGTYYKKCLRGDPPRWIRTKYFCDGRVNCAMDMPESKEPADEADRRCSATEPPIPESTRPHMEHVPQEDLATGLDLSLGTIVLVSILSLSVIACVIVLTLKRCGLLGGPNSESEECPNEDQTVGMLELSRIPNRSQENTYITHNTRPQRLSTPDISPNRSRTIGRPNQDQNIGSWPPAVSGPSPGSWQPPKEPPISSLHPDEAPPPSYNEIFPPGQEPEIPGVQTPNIDGSDSNL